MPIERFVVFMVIFIFYATKIHGYYMDKLRKEIEERDNIILDYKVNISMTAEQIQELKKKWSKLVNAGIVKVLE